VTDFDQVISKLEETLQTADPALVGELYDELHRYANRYHRTFSGMQRHPALRKFLDVIDVAAAYHDHRSDVEDLHAPAS
jgi:hypothetical protein